MRQQLFILRERPQLDELLEDERTSLLIIHGEEGSAEELFFEAQRMVLEPWRRVALLVDASILTADEASAWRIGKGAGFVVLDGARRPVQKGPLSALTTTSGTVSVLKLRQAFARADRSLS